MATAIIYIPADLVNDSLYAREGLDHLERRGYALGGIYRAWSEVERLLKNGFAQVVVLARQSHREPHHIGPAEFVRGEPCRFISEMTALLEEARHCVPRSSRADEYRTVVILAARRRNSGLATGPLTAGGVLTRPAPARTAEQLIADAARRWADQVRPPAKRRQLRIVEES